MNPILTGLLAEEWANKPPKPTALGTPLRYSSAHGCARQMAYHATGTPPSDPMDEGDAWAPGIGTLLHEAAQEAIRRVYKASIFEDTSHLGDYISGSCDALILSQDILSNTGEDLGGEYVLWEFKTMGEFAFDKQVGYNRRAAKVGNGEGPKRGAIAQAGMNALGLERKYNTDIQTILMGSVSLSPLSVKKAAEMGLFGFARFGAEFRIPRDEWEPLAMAEFERLDGIGEMLAMGILPDRTAVDDQGRTLYLNPRGKDWQCDYCPFRTTCIYQGEGEG